MVSTILFLAMLVGIALLFITGFLLVMFLAVFGDESSSGGDDEDDEMAFLPWAATGTALGEETDHCPTILGLTNTRGDAAEVLVNKHDRDTSGEGFHVPSRGLLVDHGDCARDSKRQE